MLIIGPPLDLDWLSVAAERLAEGLWDSLVRRNGAALHHLFDIVVDFAHIDDVDAGFCRQVAVIKHGGCRPVVIRGAEQVGAAHAVDIPSVRSDLRVGRDPRRGWW